MIRTAVAGLAFALLYGLGIRLYIVLRAGRDADRWHVPGVAAAALVGGAGFYVAQQIRAPHVPQWIDVAAFLIMAVAAAAIPVILETSRVIQTRLLRDSTIRVPEQRSDSRAPEAAPNSDAANGP